MAMNICSLIKTDCGYYVGGECYARNCLYTATVSANSTEYIGLLGLRYMSKILINQQDILKRIAALEQQTKLK